MGKVQGVFYRDSTQKQAKILGLTGWIKNKEDGTVEVRACGEAEKIKSLIDWLHQGPPRAKVQRVEWAEIPEENYLDFKIEK